MMNSQEGDSLRAADVYEELVRVSMDVGQYNPDDEIHKLRQALSTAVMLLSSPQLAALREAAEEMWPEDDGDDVCDRCMRSGVQVSQVDESGNTLCAECAGGEFDYETRAECVVNQDHGEDCDDDGFCNRCGHQ